MLMASIAQQHNEHLAFYNAHFRYGTREELYTKGGFCTSRQDTNYVTPITPIYIGNYCSKIILSKTIGLKKWWDMGEMLTWFFWIRFSDTLHLQN